MYVYIPGPLDDLDHEDRVVVLQEAVRCDSDVLCGVHRCGEGQITMIVPAHPFLTPSRDPDEVTA